MVIGDCFARHLPRRLSRACFSLLLFLALPPCARAWEIAEFRASVEVHDDSTASVTETITADFDGEPRHGLYRDIPIHYTDRAGQHFRLRLRVEGVTDEAGQERRWRLEPAGRYQRIRVGDPDLTVTGRQVYRIRYAVQRGAIRFFPDHDECYWNLTGNEWAVPMRAVWAEIGLPEGASRLRAAAFFGGYGSRDELRQIEIAGSLVRFSPDHGLGPYEGLTAVVSWSPGVVHPPSPGQVLAWWLQDNWVYGLPLAALGVMLWLWRTRGRDPTPEPIAVQYSAPDGLTPAEAGALIDQRVDLRDITATVIDLAVRGYLRIEPIEGALLGLHRVMDYTLESLKPWAKDATLKPHERTVLKGLFGLQERTRLSDLSQQFYAQLPDIRSDIYDSLIKAGYFDSDPQTVRSVYVAAGVVLAVVLGLALHVTRSWHQIPPLATTIACALAGLVVVVFSPIMPRRTFQGARATDRIAGFLEFLRRTDQDRMRRMNDPSLFERCLPFALAFGIAQLWARAFEGIYTTAPSWYAGRWDQFSTTRFGYDLTHTINAMGQTFTSQPRSQGSSGSWGGSGFGGGGFSGGGGGGGGGGAW
ncbi:MAG: DUF2207 domain-containing protein [Candidatus Omnitrophica bacterium]|nr:DUF2207 domain-containing protein [Candidatus Omnitrophota bacterium]